MSNDFIGAAGTEPGVPFEFKASAAETASTTHNSLNVAESEGSLYVVVNVTASSGTTPTLTVVVEGSMDNGSNWFKLGTIGANGYNVGDTAVTAPSNLTTTATVRGMFPAAQSVRTRSVVGGTTPSFTYSVEGVVR